MYNTFARFDGSFYDYDYFERGKQSGKGWLEDYRWMPRRSFREAFAFIDHLNLDETSYVLDFGGAKGYLVKALRLLDIRADCCDISNYALSFAPEGSWCCSDEQQWIQHRDQYTHIVAKDVFEHMTVSQLINILSNYLPLVAKKMMCVIPMGENGSYRIKEYNTEISHLIADDEMWWENVFEKTGWDVIECYHHVMGLKDNWRCYSRGLGNCVFISERYDNK